MKKALIVLLALVLVFAGIWIAKSKTPAERPDSYATGLTENAWWNISLGTEGVDSEWILDPEIPDNYIPVPGEDELYMVVDENGNITKYRHRTQQEDGSWVWEDINPDIPDNYEPVEGLENVYKVTAEDGSVKYYRYVRNEDDTFAFVEVDQYGNDINDTNPSGDEIPENYVNISGNIYAVKDDNGVVIRYKERRPNGDGGYTWQTIERPKEIATGTGQTHYDSGEGEENPESPSTSQPSTQGNGSSGSGGSIGQQTGNQTVTEQHSDGTYTETETIYHNETSGGWITTYQTIVTKTYDSSGNLISTKKDGPTEVSKSPVTNSETGEQPDKSKIASTLQAEAARMSAGMNFRTDLAQQVLANLNAERAANGLNALSMSTSSDAYLLAQTRAAAMATYDYSDYNSPLYGSLSDMCATFGIHSVAPSENTWKTDSSKTADAIHARFMSLSGSRESCLSSEYGNIGIAIVEKNGNFYICEVLMR